MAGPLGTHGEAGDDLNCVQSGKPQVASPHQSSLDNFLVFLFIKQTVTVLACRGVVKVHESCEQ